MSPSKEPTMNDLAKKVDLAEQSGSESGGFTKEQWQIFLREARSLCIQSKNAFELDPDNDDNRYTCMHNYHIFAERIGVAAGNAQEQHNDEQAHALYADAINYQATSVDVASPQINPYGDSLKAQRLEELSDLYAQAGQTDQAVQALSKIISQALTIDPTRIYALTTKRFALDRDYRSAVDALREVIRMNNELDVIGERPHSPEDRAEWSEVYVAELLQKYFDLPPDQWSEEDIITFQALQKTSKAAGQYTHSNFSNKMREVRKFLPTKD